MGGISLNLLVVEQDKVARRREFYSPTDSHGTVVRNSLVLGRPLD